MPGRFRPCIDLRHNKVTQIVGSSLTESGEAMVHFESQRSAGDFACMFAQDGLSGGHVIRLDKEGSSGAAKEALAATPGILQLGGGMTADNAKHWLDAGAAALIFTSWIFSQGRIDYDRLKQLEAQIGRERIVLDLSCTRTAEGGYAIATDQWTRISQTNLSAALFGELSRYASEFLVHAIDHEGKGAGVDQQLLALLNDCAAAADCKGPLPITYAGGISSEADLDFFRQDRSKLDFTVGSALDIFGGTALRYADLVRTFSSG